MKLLTSIQRCLLACRLSATSSSNMSSSRCTASEISIACPEIMVLIISYIFQRVRNQGKSEEKNMDSEKFFWNTNIFFIIYGNSNKCRNCKNDITLGKDSDPLKKNLIQSAKNPLIQILASGLCAYELQCGGSGPGLHFYQACVFKYSNIGNFYTRHKNAL